MGMSIEAGATGLSIRVRMKKQSRLRVLAGRFYYWLKRQYDWRLSGKRFARRREARLLPVVQIRHQTPLYRNLPRLEMWLQENKVTNLRRAVPRVNRVVLRPGEVFSFWRLVGKPTKRRGYVEGMVLNHGRIVPGIGGGLCQLTNLIYWMTLHTPLTVIERWRHSYDVFPDSGRTQPFGSGATCAFPSLDLQIKNNTDQTFQLHLEITPTQLRGEWRCERDCGLRYEVYEDFHQITQAYTGQYLRRNSLRRRVFHGDRLVRDEFITENCALMMYEPFLTGSTAAPADGESKETHGSNQGGS